MHFLGAFFASLSHQLVCLRALRRHSKLSEEGEGGAVGPAALINLIRTEPQSPAAGAAVRRCFEVTELAGIETRSVSGSLIA